MTHKKTVIIVHGGSLKAAFAAGAVYGLSKIGINTADIIFATSSSTPTMAYFTAGQFESIKNIWRNELGNSKFIKYTNLVAGDPVFNLNYLINTVFKKRDPLFVKNIASSKSLYSISLYNYQRGKLEFFNNRRADFTKNFWPALHAGITIHDKNLAHKKAFHKFVDADLDPFAIYRESLLPKDSNVLIILNHKNLDFDFKKWAGLKLFSFFQSKNFPQGVKDKLKIRRELTASGLQAFEKFKKSYRPIIIQPPPKTKLHALSILARNNKKLRYLFSAGEASVYNLHKKSTKKLKPFISRARNLGHP